MLVQVKLSYNERMWRSLLLFRSMHIIRDPNSVSFDLVIYIRPSHIGSFIVAFPECFFIGWNIWNI